MQIKLNHVGIIKDSTIALDGLTVITGKNNSGKTTVGKTLYALLDATSDLKLKAQLDRRAYIEKQLHMVKNTLDNNFRYIDPEDVENGEIRRHFFDCPVLYALLFNNFETDSNLTWEDFAHEVERELKIVDAALFKPFLRERIVRRYDIKTDTSHMVKLPPREFDEYRQEALSALAQLFDDLAKDPELIEYARESINQTLNKEFSGQVQPVRAPDAVSTVELTGSGEDAPIYFRFSIVNNGIMSNEEPVFFSTPFKQVYMIDDPFILDSLSAGISLDLSKYRNFKTIFNPAHIYPHSYSLRKELASSKQANVFEQTILNDSLKSIKTQIDCVLPGSFEFSSDGDYYVENGAKVKLSNLATGSKIFSIVKLLLERGKINDSTMLILDEPEAHLHPKWQNAFAETIVLLVKELKVTVLLTTHSPNFMLALDANMRKHDIIEQTNFYQTDTLEDGFVRYHCVNDDLGQIYDDFLQYLSEMKVLRDQYLYPYSEEEEEEESE